MGAFTKIPQNTFNELQVDAGVLLSSFNPASPSISDSDIITATTGGITVSCVPTYSDWGEDVDNCPNNMKELKHLEGWESKIATTAIGTSPEMIKMSLGAADISGAVYTLTSDVSIVSTKTYYTRSGSEGSYTYTKVASPVVADIATYYELTTPDYKVVPRADLSQSDFQTIWWVGDKADGGLVAVKLINALSTGGFSLKTTKNGKGNIDIELTGHVSINAQTTMPMEFYSTTGTTS